MTAALKRSLTAPHNLRLSQRSSHAACAVGISAWLRDLAPAALLLRQRGGGGQVKSTKGTCTRPSWMALLDPFRTSRVAAPELLTTLPLVGG
jgi:hypothetical protein